MSALAVVCQRYLPKPTIISRRVQEVWEKERKKEKKKKKLIGKIIMKKKEGEKKNHNVGVSNVSACMGV